MKRLIALLTLAAVGCAGAADQELERIFDEPPADRGVYVWWHWQGGNVTEYGITRDLEAMKRAGVSGATIFNIQDVGWDSQERFRNPFCAKFDYMGPEWFRMVKFAIEEAKRLGLVLGLHNCPGYSTSGGPWITPELGMKKLVWCKDGETPETKLGFYRDIAKVETSDGLYRFGYTCTGKCTHPSPPDVEGASLEADKLSLAAIDRHLDHLLDTLKANGVTASKPGLAFILMDSYEACEGTWTDDFAEEFRRRRGYDPIPFLPVKAGMASGHGAKADRQFKNDFVRTHHELQTERHYRRFKERLNAAGYEFHLEPYGGDFDNFEAAANCDVPMTEFWEGHPYWSKRWESGGSCRMAGPVGRALGRDIIGAEAFTGYPLDDPFAFTPRDLKYGFDLSMANGLNRLSLHHWEHQPLNAKWKPGFSMGPWGTHFGENATWFEPGLPFYRYMHRVQAMLQSGRLRCDDLGFNYFEGEDSDALPMSMFPTETELTSDKKIRVKSSGRTYPIVSINADFKTRTDIPWDAVEARAIAKLDEYEKAGLPVSRDGNKREFLRARGLPPTFEIKNGVKDVRACAREADGVAFWFVANLGREPVECEVALRPLEPRLYALQLWDPETLEKRNLDGVSFASGQLHATVRLEAESSVFLVATDSPRKETPKTKRGETAAPIVIGADGWKLMFAPNGGALTNAVALATLKSWTDFTDPGIRYYSGTATYETEFVVPKDGEYQLALGEVRDIAEVFVDGEYCFTLWHRPYRRALALSAGKHKLAIKVTNAWTNRLIGDERYPEDCTVASVPAVFPEKNIPIGRPVIALSEAIRGDGERKVQRIAFSTWKYLLSDKDLRPAGLLGPEIEIMGTVPK